MTRSRHLRRILAASVVASVSITWGAGVAFATDSPDIDQSNDVSVSQTPSCEVWNPTTSEWESGPSYCTGAEANTGDNAHGSDPQGNLTLQADVSVSTGALHEHSMDAFAIGLFIAVAAGTDAAAAAANYASSDNDLTLSDDLTTGNAVAGNTATLFGDQANSNGGSVVTIRHGSGDSAIGQSNDAYVTADGESSSANSGGNEQGSGGQFNGTGQLALAGAVGTPAVALSLGVGIAAAGDAAAAAGNVSTHGDGDEEDGFSNFQDVTNVGETGDATAANTVLVGQPARAANGTTPAVPEDAFDQLNTNSGNAYTLVGGSLFSFAGSFIGQYNTIEVDPSYNTAEANTGYNSQGSGPQVNGNLQLAGAGAGGAWAGSVGLLGVALALGGDGTAIAANSSDAGNGQVVSNDLTTGDATAQNFVGVIATQTNENSGNAGALSLLAFVGVSVGAIVQSNTLDVEANDNYADATSGYNSQTGGYQGNGTLQGAGALAGGGWAGALGALALAGAGDATALAANVAGSLNDSTVESTLHTGQSLAENVVRIDNEQENTNSGWAAGVTALDLIGVGVGVIVQSNVIYSEADGNYAFADSGSNTQGTGGQGNLTLQGGVALAGAGDALSLGLLAGAAGGDAAAAAANAATSSNTQSVTNDATTGVAGAHNFETVQALQSNTNDGDGEPQANAVGLAVIVGAGAGIGFIGQFNYVAVDGSYNTAIANSGYNAQWSGPQTNITGQLALAGAQGGGALSLALVGAGAFGGDAGAAAANTATSSNLQTVSNTLTTGLAEAINSVQVTATQANVNHGNAVGAVIISGHEHDAGAIVQNNTVEVAGDGNTAAANTGENLQVAGGQVNVTVQIAADGATGGGSAAGALGGAVSVDGDATSISGNSSVAENTTDATNTMVTGNATAINQTGATVHQSNDNDGDAVAVGL